MTPTKTGGINGAINSFDAGRIAQHVVGIDPLTGNQLVVADVSGNGTISSFDAGQIALFTAGLKGFRLDRKLDIYSGESDVFVCQFDYRGRGFYCLVDGRCFGELD